ncbi:hypothetical protein [Dickeya parazeae]|uniref:hypothetical protein n=1 Tax=Dickeya parazeae TaxID=2893572 RepID=UPI001AECC5CE|nr:hypothetical protein [Dickeya parazeae]MBP2836923.1 hypothetical protein [Dickeya parazeae]
MSDIRPESIRVLISEVWRRIDLIRNNHFFYIYFILIIVLAGTISIWYVVFTPGEGMWEKLLSNMNTINLMAFSIPLLATTIFDKMMIEKVNKNNEPDSIPVQKWLKLGTILSCCVIGFLYGFGFKSNSDVSFWSFSAWIVSLLFWALANIENPNYSLKADPKSSSGGTELHSSTELRRG